MTSHKGREAAAANRYHQIFGESFGTAAEATTAMDGFFRQFNSRDKVMFLQAQGVKFLEGTEGVTGTARSVSEYPRSGEL